jgi:hypothetical protein
MLHPDAKVVSLGDASAPGIALDESLLFLSFLDGNSHPGPVYWGAPVLSSTIYPEYLPRLSRQIREEGPLIVAYRDGAHTPLDIPGYELLVSAQGDFGYRYLYGPKHETHTHAAGGPLMLSRNGSRFQPTASSVEHEACPSVPSAMETT